PGFFNCRGDFPGRGGSALLVDSTRLFMGGGGGAGHANNGAISAGSRGGGIAIAFAPVMVFAPITGMLAGADSPVGVEGDGAGGAGAGGTIVMKTDTYVLLPGAFPNLGVNGGRGADTDNNDQDRCFGPGGGGAGGRILADNISDDYLVNVASGSAGFSANSTISSCQAAGNGSQDGEDGSIAPAPTLVRGSLPVTADFNFVQDNATFDFTSLTENAEAVEWTFGPAGAGSSEADPSYTYAAGGTYTVQLIAIGTCRSDTVTREVTVESEPPAQIQASLALNADAACAPWPLGLTDLSSGPTTSSSFRVTGPGLDTTLSGPTATVSLTQLGIYAVELTVTGPAGAVGSFTDGGTIEIGAAPQTSFSFLADSLVVSFTNTSTGADSYFWDFGDGQTSTAENPVHTYETAGVYNVTLNAANEFCSRATALSVLAGETTGTDEPAGAQLVRLYPNPTDGLLHVEQWAGGTLKLRTSDGRLLATYALPTEREQIDLSRFAAGTYLLELSRESRSFGRLLIKTD
ncbi:MAG: PKD domain-containing protein, partial [Saprospiraceae bacterium]